MTGATEAPDVGVDALERLVPTKLEPQFELEGVLLEALDLGAVEAGSGSIENALLREVDLDGAKLRALRLLDVSAEEVSAANGTWGGATLRRVEFRRSRLTGLDLGEARLDEVRFQGCKLDYANFRHAEIGQVTFEDCVLDCADFQGARIFASRFASCDLVEADFTKAALERVDLRGSKLQLAGSVLGLRGATIDPLQLMDLSRSMAAEAGIEVGEA